MATLVLTAVGSLVGGPIGGAVGALIGNAVDQRLLAPKGRRGPRLGELGVQTSSYGASIPRLYGTMRVAGTVIWATDLIEDRHRTSAGKGQPKVTTYSNSASFAVALSGRGIASIERIWADGKLLRGAAGDWKSQVAAFRLHEGGEGQPADPLIAALEGDTPAYRGMAYAVFEGLELADFGNRIPSLSFEVVADAGTTSIGAVARDLGGGRLDGPAVPVLAGFAATGDSVRGVIEALGEALPLPLREDGGRLVLGAGPARTLDLGEAGAGADGPGATLSRSSAAAAALPDEVALGYYEPARDWQAGLQRARSAGGPGRRVQRIELAAALDAGTAKAIAEARLARHWIERQRVTLRLPFRRMAVVPGDVVTLAGLPGRWRVAEAALERMVVELALVPDAPLPAIAAPAAAGRASADPDAVAGQTRLALIDLPPLDGVAGDRLRIWAAAAGTGTGWRRAALLASSDDGASWSDAGSTAAPATLGGVDGVLAAGPATLFDLRTRIEVTLANDAMWLESHSDDALAAGANLAAIGRELIQFGTVEPLGGRRFRLSRLLRGRRGSEAAIADHQPGEMFVLIEAAALAAIELPPAHLGRGVRVLAVGIGDAADGVAASAIAEGRALKPPAPVGLVASRQADGSIAIRWTRRSRSGWAWLDGGDVPLGEEREAYRLTLGPRTIEVAAPGWTYDAAAQAADGAGGVLAIAVRQLGTLAASDPAEIFFAGQETTR